LPTIFHNTEQESGSKSRVRALTHDPTRTQIADPVTRDPVPSLGQVVNQARCMVA